ncbi:late competence protein comec, dna transport [Ligilactobacillus hayakitensis DSM 18933 = JCM 14209]|uniref:Late competence protein comec, dna transport n=2 Tax=Ligilactobacillus TaxID=2767887 RepID=A0A0R1WTJ2_9LACO|nr:late competence protein comec, dna transport [Ligilactobacillus hayakitensis DSM 18933 = JCM 14209]
MIRQISFFSSILCLCLVYIFFSSSWIFLLLLLLIFIRILTLRNNLILLIILLIVLGIVSNYFMLNQNIRRKIIRNEIRVTNQHIKVYPDNIKVNGNLVTLTGFWDERKQNIMVSYRVKSKAEKEKFAKINQILYLSCDGVVSNIRGPGNENEFNFQRLNYSKKIYNTLQCKKIIFSKLPKQNPIQNINNRIHIIRIKIFLYLNALPYNLRGYAVMLTIGMRNQDFEKVNQNIKNMGLLYIFCLSGMHVQYIVKFIKKLLQSLRITSDWTSVILLFILPCYLILAGSSSSIIRAVMMVWLPIFSDLILKNKLDTLTSWSLTMLINLVFNPLIAYNMGMQLSYLLSLALILCENKNIIELNLKMTGYSIPLMLWHTYQWNLLTTIFSICIVPVFEFVIIPAVALGIFIHPFTGISENILALISLSFSFFNKLPFLVTFGKPSLWVVVLLILNMFLLEIDSFRKFGLIFQVGIYLFSFFQIHYFSPEEVTFFDIGQGDSALIKGKGSRDVTVIDTGGRVAFKQKKWQQPQTQTTSGQRVIQNYLYSKGITRINSLYLTHKDDDHIGNFPSLSKGMKIDEIYVPSGMEAENNFLDKVNQTTLYRTRIVPITSQNYSKQNSLQILHPFERGKGENEDSLVLIYSFKGIKFLFMGDLDQENELKILQRYPALKCDVLKVGHHGSKTSSSADFISTIKPKEAIISAGYHNMYQHPNIETIETLNLNNVVYNITFETGMVKFIESKNRVKEVIYRENKVKNVGERIQ